MRPPRNMHTDVDICVCDDQAYPLYLTQETTWNKSRCVSLVEVYEVVKILKDSKTYKVCSKPVLNLNLSQPSRGVSVLHEAQGAVL